MKIKSFFEGMLALGVVIMFLFMFFSVLGFLFHGPIFWISCFVVGGIIGIGMKTGQFTFKLSFWLIFVLFVARALGYIAANVLKFPFPMPTNYHLVDVGVGVVIFIVSFLLFSRRRKHLYDREGVK